MVLVQSPTNLAIRTMNDAAQGFGSEYNEAEHKLDVFPFGDKSKKSQFTYSQPDADHVILEGALPGGGPPLLVKLKRVDLSKFLLTNRGFRWINERPFNR